MTNLDIAQRRLRNQGLTTTRFADPAEVVAWMGAVQSQDYAGAKWALAQRAQGLTDEAVDRAFADGDILRTHVMRPTWHFIAPDDIRWLLALTAPRVNAVNAYYYRSLGLDDAIFSRSTAALEKVLSGGKHLTRRELATELRRAGVATDGLRLAFLLIRAELDAVICSGARRGRQFTYALLEERAPQGRTLQREEALAELASRYFTSHGPATLQDFGWWSGLEMSDAKRGIEIARARLSQERAEGQTYWFSSAEPAGQGVSQPAWLLPNYDEYAVAYKDRSAILDRTQIKNLGLSATIVLTHTIVIGGQVVGTWRRTLTKSAAILQVRPFSVLTKAEREAIDKATARYGAFLQLPVVWG